MNRSNGSENAAVNATKALWLRCLGENIDDASANCMTTAVAKFFLLLDEWDRDHFEHRAITKSIPSSQCTSETNNQSGGDDESSDQ